MFVLGERVGKYEIGEIIGRGGMGVVFKAHDVVLDRFVALKQLNGKFSAVADYEARTVAALQHPNICEIYDVGPDYLVLELVDGRTPTGPLHPDAVRSIAGQVASALDAAHVRGVVHCDLKPGNVKVGAKGHVKLLDFGLAKAVPPTPVRPFDETAGRPAPHLGDVVGTLPYMSPEQRRGDPLDKRTDIWSFGVLIYHLLTGRLPFGADGTDPDPLPLKGVPSEWHRLIARCLERDRETRLRDIGDAMTLVEPPAKADVEPKSRTTAWLVASVAAAVALVGTAAYMAGRMSAVVPPRAGGELRLPVLAPDGVALVPETTFELSPDGQTVAISASHEGKRLAILLWSLGTGQVRRLPGTDDGVRPFWSPDSQFVAYSKGGVIYRIPVEGGTPQQLTPSQMKVSTTGAWNSRNGVVYVNDRGGLSAVDGRGQDVVLTEKREGELHHEFPVFLPDGQHFLYFRHAHPVERSGIYIGALGVSPSRQPAEPLLPATDGPAFVSNPDERTGSLFFMVDETLYSRVFDPTTLTLVGRESTVLTGVRSTQGSRLFSVSGSGQLLARQARTMAQLTRYDRAGRALPLVIDAQDVRDLALDPLNRFGIASIAGRINRVPFDGAPVLLTTLHSGTDSNFVLSSDGTQVIFRRSGGKAPGFFLAPTVPGAGEPVAIAPALSPDAAWPTSWTPAADLMLFSHNEGGNMNLKTVRPSLGDRASLMPLLATDKYEGYGRLSPDGRWLAYVGDVAPGERQLLISAFDPLRGKIVGGVSQVSVEKVAAFGPRWRQDGNELYFRSDPEGAVMAVDVSTKPLVNARPRKLFSTKGGLWDVAADGESFLVAVPDNSAPPFVMLQNWRKPGS